MAFGFKGKRDHDKDWRKEAELESDETIGVAEKEIYPPVPTNWTSVSEEDYPAAPEDWEKHIVGESDDEEEPDEKFEPDGEELESEFEPDYEEFDAKGRAHGSQKRREDVNHKRRWRWLEGLLKSKKVEGSDGAKPMKGKKKNLKKKNKSKR